MDPILREPLAAYPAPPRVLPSHTWEDYAPVLVAEVLSPSTSAKDRIEKRAICEENKVRYFLLLDPSAKTIEAYHWVEGRYVDLPTPAGRLTLDLDTVALDFVVSSLFPK